ncbi:Phosphatidylglycerophosphatase and protein-tyrosine phosphatase 1 [Stylosanthes scabra]|uniref:Phosphatidylglycerophosphatase and protein-tyrosine phosphatase 1 n=1 Tax=Stylosanthes scabra TaxID=79078 RepID=A0ABU6SFQ0_9FABA|nr:Phosphatidylglycerophosphatase and protein-tyrosine phosphatase 1 [Stylosanthes scabra]
MRIEELKSGGEVEGNGEEERSSSFLGYDAKKVLVGAGARALFYPTLLYNVVRNKIQSEFRWWDKVDEFILLGAVPFPIDVPRLKELGVRGVVTLNESYETLVPTTLYYAHGIDHLVIPTRDYCFAPSMHDICRAVDFIHENALSGSTTYVHCKAGRGRSTTVVICYLVHHKLMTPEGAYDYVKSIRPRVLLASSQWQAVQDYYCSLMGTRFVGRSPFAGLFVKAKVSEAAIASRNHMLFDDNSVVVITESDLEGYDPSIQLQTMPSEIWADLSVVYRVGVAGRAALARISCLWLRCGPNQKISTEKLSSDASCSIRSNNNLGGISIDIHVY